MVKGGDDPPGEDTWVFFVKGVQEGGPLDIKGFETQIGLKNCEGRVELGVFKSMALGGVQRLGIRRQENKGHVI